MNADLECCRAILRSTSRGGYSDREERTRSAINPNAKSVAKRIEKPQLRVTSESRNATPKNSVTTAKAGDPDRRRGVEEELVWRMI